LTFGTLLSSQGTGAHRFRALQPLAGHNQSAPFTGQKEKLRPLVTWGQIAPAKPKKWGAEAKKP
jgi:hypothetical protein